MGNRLNKWIRVTAPGLPPQPRLYVDRQDKRAVVKVRLATWQSWELARKTSTLIRFLINASVVWWLWDRFDMFHYPQIRFLFTCLGFCLCYAATKALIPAAPDGFMARQFFASSSKI